MAETGQALTSAADSQGAMPAQTSRPSVVPPQIGRLFGNDRTMRQAGLLLGLLAAIAVGVGLFFWAQEPVYRPLYSNLDDQDAAQVLTALDQSGVAYRIDERTGTITVPTSEVHGLRLRLASEGLPSGGGVGYELLQQDSSFGTSQSMETARFQYALETELARSISTLQNVESARVHLAIPRQSVFMRDRSEPRASVVLKLVQGRNLSERQVTAIVNLVARSVPELSEENIALVDQQGRLLTSLNTEGDGRSATADQFVYQEQLEDTYARRIENLLTPMFGGGRVRAQVSARLNFAVEESTEEVYDPEGSVVRSEQTSEERRRQREREAIGIPGALSNQPPGAGTTDPDADQSGEAAAADNVDITQTATRNFEISRTLRHVRSPVGTVERLSVAVLVDQHHTVNDEGEVVREPRSDEELNQITGLVSDAVGLDVARGDTINVISAAFQVPADGEPMPDPTWYEMLREPWAIEAGKLLLALLLTLLLVMAVIRPLIFGLLGRVSNDPEDADEQADALEEGEGLKQLTGPGTGGPMLPASMAARMASYEDTLMSARQVVNQEPELAASVVKSW